MTSVWQSYLVQRAGEARALLSLIPLSPLE
jgi:hypothetical protein